MAGSKITYEGPSSAYTVEHDGKWFTLARGVAESVPAELATELAKVEGHHFTGTHHRPEGKPHPSGVTDDDD